MKHMNDNDSLDVAFFDTSWNQILRFGSAIAELLVKRKKYIKTAGICLEEDKANLSNDKSSFDLVFRNADICQIFLFLEKHKPRILVFVSNRIPDLALILFAKKNGVKTVMLQHGMLFEGAHLNNINRYEVYAAIKKLKKTTMYLKVIKSMCKFDQQSFFQILLKIFMKRRAITVILQNCFSMPLIADCAMVIGEHWKKYYHDTYAYRYDNIYIMGNHDLDLLDLKTNPIEDAICYIANTTVEDGKVMQNVFNQFIEALADSMDKNVKFYIKLHPRSDKSLYEKTFRKHNVRYIRKEELPYVHVYIGHNSTLISRALYISDKVLLWWFKEEPELFYEEFAFRVCTNAEELNRAIKDAISEKNKKNTKGLDIQKYSYKQEGGAFNYCAEKIIDFL